MRLLLAAPLLVLARGHALRSQTACCSWLPCCAGTNEGSGRLSHNEIRYCLPQTGLSSTMGDLITAPAAHVEARSQNAGLVTTRTISTRRDDAHRTSPTLTPSAGASSELANRHSHLPVGRALEEQLFLPPAARGIASFATVCAAIFAVATSRITECGPPRYAVFSNAPVRPLCRLECTTAACSSMPTK